MGRPTGSQLLRRAGPLVVALFLAQIAFAIADAATSDPALSGDARTIALQEAGYGGESSPAGVVVTGNPNPPTGTSISVTITVANSAGAPLAGATCSASISLQPASGASISPASFATGPDGKATLSLNTGNTSGDVVVRAVCGSVVSSTVFKVGAIITAPDTGTGESEASSSRSSTNTLAFGVALGALVAGLTGWRLLAGRS